MGKITTCSFDSLSEEMKNKVANTLTDCLQNMDIIHHVFNGTYQENVMFAEPRDGSEDKVLRCKMLLHVSPPDDPAGAQFPIVLPIPDDEGQNRPLLIGHVRVQEITLYAEEADFHKEHAQFVATTESAFMVGPAQDFLNSLIPPQHE